MDYVPYHIRVAFSISFITINFNTTTATKFTLPWLSPYPAAPPFRSSTIRLSDGQPIHSVRAELVLPRYVKTGWQGVIYPLPVSVLSRIRVKLLTSEAEYWIGPKYSPMQVNEDKRTDGR